MQGEAVGEGDHWSHEDRSRKRCDGLLSIPLSEYLNCLLSIEKLLYLSLILL